MHLLFGLALAFVSCEDRYQQLAVFAFASRIAVIAEMWTPKSFKSLLILLCHAKASFLALWTITQEFS